MATPRLRALLAASVSIAVAGCGGDSGSSGNPAASTVTVIATPTPTPTPSATATTASIDVTPCLNQKVAGRSVASLVVPDVLTLDMTQASGFPNGRTLTDPVIDLELAALFLDLSKHPVDTLAKIPLNPSGNDVPLLAAFPYLGNAQGGVPQATGGAGFVFRTDAASAYRRIDRAAEPAISTALVRAPSKNAYNDDSPVQDATGKWVPEYVATLTGLADALRDDFARAGLSICAKVS